MGLDIRIPIGVLFTVFGALLAGFGAVSDKQIYARSLGVNVNMWWGIALLAFGLVMLAFGRHRSKRAIIAEKKPVTRAVGRSR